MMRVRAHWLLFGLLLTAGCVRSSTTENSPAPAFDLADTAGGRASLESLKGNVIVLDFWATWCGPCIVEIPEYAELWRKNRGRGVEVVGVACDSEPQDVLDIIREQQIPYRQLMSDGRVESTYRAEALPTTFVIDRQGQIRKKFLGTTPQKFEKLQQAIDELLRASELPAVPHPAR
jgi:peroxiredoxin